MSKIESSFRNMVIVLAGISLISALALGFTYANTKGTIEQLKQEKKMAAIEQVVPSFDNNPDAEKYTLPDRGDIELYPAKLGGDLVGTAVRTYSDLGFSDRVWIMVGFQADNTISGLSVLEHKETPGLGSKMTEDSFKSQFLGKDPEAFRLLVKKDGGDVDAITAATISSRAVCDAVSKAYEIYHQGGSQ
jgi:Na+-translocating ferredoxin:NAD+ oxidoreductase subunit G